MMILPQRVRLTDFCILYFSAPAQGMRGDWERAFKSRSPDNRLVTSSGFVPDDFRG